MFRSMRSAPRSATVGRGGAHDVGVLAEELDRDRPAAAARSSGWMRSISRTSSRCGGGRRSSRPSPTPPAPRRSAWPAGARTSCRCPPAARARRGWGSGRGPMLEGVGEGGRPSALRVARRARPRRLRRAGVALVQQLQPVERQQVVDLVDRLRERDDVLGQAAGGDRLGVLAELAAQAPDDPVDLAGEAVDDARCGSRRPSTCRSASAAARGRCAAARPRARSAPRARSRRRA